MRVLLVVVLVACGGSKPPPPVSNATPVTAAPAPESASACGCTSPECRDDNPKALLAKMCRFRERMCGCKDQACADAVNEDYTHWMQDMAKNASSERATAITEEIAKELADHATMYQECYTKLTPLP